MSTQFPQVIHRQTLHEGLKSTPYRNILCLGLEITPIAQRLTRHLIEDQAERQF
jgi:hypothetical protein